MSDNEKKIIKRPQCSLALGAVKNGSNLSFLSRLHRSKQGWVYLLIIWVYTTDLVPRFKLNSIFARKGNPFIDLP